MDEETSEEVPLTQKRHRSCNIYCPCRHSLSRTIFPGGTAFPAAIEEPVKAAGGDREECWHCGATPAAVYYLFSEEEFKPYKGYNFLNIEDPFHRDSQMLLCTSCGRSLDDSSEPGFCFVPTDLEFFKSYEQMDLLQRIEHYNRHRCQITRTCPSSEDYRQHQLRHNVIRPEDPDGLYAKYTLEDRFARRGCCNKSRTIRLGKLFAPAPWHGDPMVALRRSFSLSGLLSPQGIPFGMTEQLQELRKLYRDNDAHVKHQCPDSESETDRDVAGAGPHKCDRLPAKQQKQSLERFRPQLPTLQKNDLGTPDDRDSFGEDLKPVSVHAVVAGDNNGPHFYSPW